MGGVPTRVDGLVHIDGNVTLEATATSGDGSIGTTGAASGGTAELRADGGDLTIDGDAVVRADGNAGTGVNGGDGDGGLATIDAYDGANLSAASFGAQALGQGGSGTASAGTGFGGTARVRAHTGASITTGNLTADASGSGGNSIDGGGGFGGVAEVAALELDFDIDGYGPRHGEGERRGRNGHDRGHGWRRLWRFRQAVYRHW